MRTSSSASPSARGSELKARVLAALFGALLGALVPTVLVAQDGPTPVLVVSRERVLTETVAAETLREAETAMRAELQSRVDRVKAELGAEEEELTRLRATLPRDEFQSRVAAFDRRVREERRLTQRSAAALQTGFRRARSRLVQAMIPILIRVIRERDAQVVLDSDQILVAAPSTDVTDRVIALLDEAMPDPEIPDLDAMLAAEGEEGTPQSP